MSSNTPTPAPNSSTKEGPLSSFDRISKLVYLYRPSPSNGRKPSASSGTTSIPTSAVVNEAPRLILLASWMDAREPHIAKYTTRLQALYPDSPILLVRCFAHYFTTKAHLHSKEIEPAVPVIRSIIAEATGGGDEGGDDRQGPDMLVHVFSNGGSATLRHLYDVYADSARPGEPAKLPAHVTIFDSAPGRWQWTRSVTAFMASVAGAHWAVRLVMRSLLHLTCAFYWIMHVPWGRPGFLERSWFVHNDRTRNRAECRRTYIYSEEDRLIDYRHVEEHAAAAAGNGYVPRMEKFSGSQHVAHARVDEQRYWGIVRGSWEDEPSESGAMAGAE
ncbi:hypothetical protein VMCG_03991 [Cytospora schulzeri]|uniref:Indole-diterpene biosynthesis protein PaxU n=1 Tax=Cytospora schulzeri TaxID=448051 RepID=A0A423WTF0_9PEZI|nr:hypothetical protein VMCG_03991 [Valsa malicola]